MYKWMVAELISSMALNYTELEDYDTALDFLSDKISEDRNNPDLYFWRGIVWQRYGRSCQDVQYSNYSMYPIVKNTPESINCFRRSIANFEKAIELYNKGKSKCS